jgi:polyribonucleotide nucleotidyltransferase
MFNITKKSIQWGGKTLTLETGKIARQADGAVLVTYGETQVLCTVVGAKEDKPGQDFFPLSVHFQSKYYAGGRMPGGFFKREAKPSEYDTLTSRLIDRPIRPMFHEDYLRETQIVCTLLSHDLVNDPDMPAMIGASAALTISGIPFLDPVASARVGYINGEYVLNPSAEQLKQPESQLELIVAGTKTSVLMVESEAKELSEEIMLGAVSFGHQQIQAVIDLIISFAEACAKDPWEITTPDHSSLKKALKDASAEALRQAYTLRNKQERVTAIKAAKEAALAAAGVDTSDDAAKATAKGLLKKIEAEIVRGEIIAGRPRIDGRDNKTIRPILAEVDLLNKTHGSSLFTRGETQAIVAVTLGTADDEQIIDVVEGESKQRFLLHYNFPSFSVGEVGRMAPPGRREIGHGKLAWRALNSLIPSKEAFPYTIRLVSEITESNGSSSMATVCGSSLALMDAGVPIARPVAGIAMGLIKEGKDYAVLSDIMGDEDHLGDMDFKVAGTAQGVTALQMDIKINGITTEIMDVALHQAKAGRLHILGEMNKALSESRSDLNKNAPRITTIKIAKDKIGAVIGTGGKVIKDIVEKSGAEVNIEEVGQFGIVSIASNNADAMAIAVKMVEDIVTEPEVGKIYRGKVASIVDFGAFVTFMGPNDGLVHISEIRNERVETMADSGLESGKEVYVKLLGIDRGKFKLSMKVVNQDTGEDLDPEGVFNIKPGEGGGDRGGRRDNRRSDDRGRGDRDRRPRRAS